MFSRRETAKVLGHRWLAVLAFILAGGGARAQTPELVLLIEVDGYQQTSATQTGYLAGGFIAEVDFPAATPAGTTVTVKKPNGTTLTLQRQTDDSFSFQEYFATSAEVKAAYPNGTYDVSVTGGGANNTISVAATFTSITPTRVTNFDALQAINGASTGITWTSVPKAGDQEVFAWELLDSHDQELNYIQFSDARQTSVIVNDIPSGTSLKGALAYISYATTSANSDATTVGVGSAFSLLFPMYRVASAPAAPKSLAAYATGNQQIFLSWMPAGDLDLTGYKLERSTSNTFPASETVTIDVAADVSSYTDTGLADRPYYYYRLSAVNPYGTSPATAVVQVQLFHASGTGASRLANIATRARCGVGENVTIGGFVVSGTQAKRVLIRAVGPSLEAQGISAADILRDPTVSVYSGSTVIASNDNWTTNPNAADITSVGAQIGAASLTGTDSSSAALLMDLNPGVYTFVVNGKNSTSGIVLLEVYDTDPATGSQFVNIATRANSASGSGVTIGGFVISGEKPKTVLLRALGPTLVSQGINSNNVLPDPVIELHRGAPIIATNDNWFTNHNASQFPLVSQRIGAAPIDTNDRKSAALMLTLPPGPYTFLASDRNNSSGVVLVEVYDAD